jgi:hypothetical protein
MPSRPAQLSPDRATNIHLRAPTVAALLEYRRGDERPDETIARLIRFAKRMMPAAEARVREEFLP